VLATIFRQPRPILGMIHVGALPGTPASDAPMSALIDAAVAEARVYADAGVDGVIVENMHDTPYLKGEVGPEIVAAMTQLTAAVKATTGGPVGVQILAAANREALAVATITGADFVRVEGFCFAHVADEGLIDGCAGDLLRYRRQLGGDAVQIWADIKKKHSSHALTADLDIGGVAEAAAFMRADAVIITGSVTGDPPRIDDVRAAKEAGVPVILGSGVSSKNLGRYFELADAFIVGSAFKEGGRWQGSVERARVDAIMSTAARLRRRL
jgi:hypothetical protein